MKKFIAIVLTLVLMLSLVGCVSHSASAGTPSPAPDMSQQMVKSSGDIAQNQNSINTKQPLPKVDYSNERANLIKRITTFGSDPNKVSFIYCFTDNGQLILFSSVKGKVSNLSSYLVPDENIVKDPYFETSGHDGRAQVAGGIVIQAPDIDGSYGTNGNGIFWYDTNGVYHEWNGRYMVVDQPVKLNVEPVMVVNVK